MSTFIHTLLVSIGAFVIYAIASYILAMVINSGEFKLLDFDGNDGPLSLCLAQAVIAILAISFYFCTKYM